MVQKRNVDKSHTGPAQPKVGSPRAWPTPRPGPDQGKPGRSPGCREGIGLLPQPSSRADFPSPPALHQHCCPRQIVFGHRLVILKLNLGKYASATVYKFWFRSICKSAVYSISFESITATVTHVGFAFTSAD